MAIGIHFTPASMSSAVYDECIKRLAQAGAGHPKGRVYHACLGGAESVQVFDVWDSQESFNRFGETLLPIMHALGADPGQPMVMPIHNVIVPPAARPRAAKKAARTARPKARAKAKAARSSRRRSGAAKK
jgi:hypothetical protein